MAFGVGVSVGLAGTTKERKGDEVGDRRGLGELSEASFNLGWWSFKGEDEGGVTSICMFLWS